MVINMNEMDNLNLEINNIFGSKEKPYDPSNKQFNGFESANNEVVNIDMEINNKNCIIESDKDKVKIRFQKNYDGINTLAWLTYAFTASKIMNTKFEKVTENEFFMTIYNMSNHAKVINDSVFVETVESIMNEYDNNIDYREQLNNVPRMKEAFSIFEKSLLNIGKTTIAYKYTNSSEIFAISTEQENLKNAIELNNQNMIKTLGNGLYEIGNNLDYNSLHNILKSIDDKMNVNAKEKIKLGFNEAANTSPVLLMLIGVVEILAVIATTYLILK